MSGNKNSTRSFGRLLYSVNGHTECLFLAGPVVDRTNQKITLPNIERVHDPELLS